MKFMMKVMTLGVEDVSLRMYSSSSEVVIDKNKYYSYPNLFTLSYDMYNLYCFVK